MGLIHTLNEWYAEGMNMSHSLTHEQKSLHFFWTKYASVENLRPSRKNNSYYSCFPRLRFDCQFWLAPTPQIRSPLCKWPRVEVEGVSSPAKQCYQSRRK